MESMEENEEERRALIQEYYQIYRQLQQQHSLREHTYFDIYGNNRIKIYECAGDREGLCICNVDEESELACWKRAIEILKIYSRKEIVKHEKKAG